VNVKKGIRAHDAMFVRITILEIQSNLEVLASHATVMIKLTYLNLEIVILTLENVSSVFMTPQEIIVKCADRDSSDTTKTKCVKNAFVILSEQIIRQDHAIQRQDNVFASLT
jgi:hypothetical protein